MPSPTRRSLESDASYQARLNAWRLDRVEERINEMSPAPLTSKSVWTGKSLDEILADPNWPADMPRDQRLAAAIAVFDDLRENKAAREHIRAEPSEHEDEAREVARLAATLAAGIWKAASASSVMPHLAIREIVKDAMRILAEARKQVKEN